jgi:hypothetical protein
MFSMIAPGFCANWLGRHGVDVIPVALVRKHLFFSFLFSDFSFRLSGCLIRFSVNMGWFPLLFRDR